MGKVQAQVRLVVALGLGGFFVGESFNPDFWRPKIESMGTPIHVTIGLFGLLWIGQGLVIYRQLRTRRG